MPRFLSLGGGFCLLCFVSACAKSPQRTATPRAEPSTPALATEKPGVDVESLLRQAKAAKKGNDPDTALILVDKILAVAPKHREANWLRAWLLAGKGRTKGAIEQFERCRRLGLDPQRSKQAAGALTRLRKRAGLPVAPPRPAPKPTATPPSRELQAAWPGWLGPDRDGKSPDTGLLKQWPPQGPPLLWKARGIGKGFSSVAVVKGLVYVTGDVGGQMQLFAFDMNGRLRWRVVHDRAWTRNYPGARSTPVVDSGRVYVESGHGLVGCYEARSGRRLWVRHLSEFGGSPPEWGYAESVLIHRDLAIVTPGGSRCLAALNKTTGKTVWTSSGFSAGAQYSSCVAVESGRRTEIVAGTHGGLVAVDVRTGKLLWQNPFAARNTASCPTPATAEGYVFWAVGYGKGGICLRLTGTGARVAWTTRSMDCHHGGYIIEDGYIYGNNGGGWACLDLKTGRRLWQERAVGKGSLCYADGMLYLFSENSGVAALATCSPQGLRVTGQFSVQGSGKSWAHPVVIGGRLYLRYDDHLYCFDVRA